VAGDPTPAGIVSICLIRGLPHRILDTDNALVGDNPSALSAEFSAGDATCAAVDAELVLLWQNLEGSEAGGTMDSTSDNLIVNPYHGSTAGSRRSSGPTSKSPRRSPSRRESTPGPRGKSGPG